MMKTKTQSRTKSVEKVSLAGFLRIEIELLDDRSERARKAERMPIVMIKLMPLPTPFSVICSPIHMSIIVPAVIVDMTMKIKQPGTPKILDIEQFIDDDAWAVPALS